jgi:hypothetical protein
MAQNGQNGQNGGAQRRQRQGNFDPAQAQQRMMARYRERLEITDDTEWNAMQPLIQKVMEARRDAGAGGRGGFGGFGRGGRGGDGTNSANAGQRRPTPPANPAAEELQKAIDAKASSSEMKAALARFNDYRKGKRSDLEKAQDALRAVLTTRQEAIATLSGLL